LARPDVTRLRLPCPNFAQDDPRKRDPLMPKPLLSPRESPLLIDVAELARLTSLSVRTLRRLDAGGDIPGRVVAGRRVLFQTGVIAEWVRAGLPGRDRWTALQKQAKSR
jgi:hypothetical protein